LCHKNIPAKDACPTNYVSLEEVQQVLQKTNAYIAGVYKRFTLAASVPSVHFSGLTKSGDNNHFNPGNNAANALGTK
jgi:hypothetical protein